MGSVAVARAGWGAGTVGLAAGLVGGEDWERR